jgi:hypothetical protein
VGLTGAGPVESGLGLFKHPVHHGRGIGARRRQAQPGALRVLDEVAYLRLASVCRWLEPLADCEREAEARCGRRPHR